MPCRHHPNVPDPRCLGCRIAMGGQADSYLASNDFSVQRCYYSGVPLPEPPTSPLSEGTTPGESDEESYLLRMRFAMQEMDTQIEFVCGERFLDLGCCPGGFSTYVLNKLPWIEGDGVSLPVELGGHGLAIPESLRSRFTLHWGDMTRFNHAPEHSGLGNLDRLETFPIPPNTYDLVLADGHRPAVMQRLMGDSQRYAQDLLLVSQILAAIRAVKVGGTILIKLTLALGNRQALDGFMPRLVIALDRLNPDEPLVVLKPKSIYATAGTFYVLVRRVESVPRRRLELLLETLWVNLQAGQGKVLNAKGLNRLVSANETKASRGWLENLFAPLESMRREARQRQ